MVAEALEDIRRTLYEWCVWGTNACDSGDSWIYVETCIGPKDLHYH